MESNRGTKVEKTGAVLTPRAASTAVVEELRTRHVQTEMRLRELEDRSRRDCMNQEHELDVLKLENNKLKAKIEDYRMADSAPKPAFGEGTADESQARYSTKKYRSARNSVEQARAELKEIQAKLAATRQQLQDARRQRGFVNLRGRVSHAEFERSRLCEEMRGEATRQRLRSLECHVEVETDRAAELMDSAKYMRREIDVQLNIQGRSDDVYRERERTLRDLNNEISFLTEVCTVLFEERDGVRESLRQIQQNAEEENLSYDKVFREFMSVEGNDKEKKTRLRNSIKKLQKELVEVTAERKQIERSVENERLTTPGRGSNCINGSPVDRAFALCDEDDGVTGLNRQLTEFEKYFTRFCEIAGSDDILDVKNFVCNRSDERFQLYKALHNAQEELRECERLREALFASEDEVISATDDERGARLELNAREEELQRLQKEITEEELRTELATTCLDAALPLIQELFTTLTCNDSAITSVYGMSDISHGSVCAFLSALEQRLEEYMALWVHVQQMNPGSPSTGEVCKLDSSALKGFGQPVSALKRPINVSDAEDVLP